MTPEDGRGWRSRFPWVRDLTNRSGMSLMLVRIAVMGLSTICAIVLVQALGPNEYGLYAAGLSVASLAFVFGPVGIDQLQLFHGLSHQRALVLARWVAAGTAGLGTLLALVWPGLESTSRLCAALLGMAAAFRIMAVPWYITPHKRLDFAQRAKREGFMLLAPVVLTTVMAVFTGDAVLCVAVGAGLSAIIAAVAQTTREKQDVVPRQPALSRGLPYAASAAIFTLYTTIGLAILSAFRPSVEVGQYKAAFMFLTAASIVPIVLNNDILRARLAALVGDRAHQFRLIRLSLIRNLLVGSLTFLGLRYFGVPLTSVIYGPGFEDTAEFLTILSIAVAPLTVASWSANSLVGLGQVKQVLLFQSFAFGVSAVANLLLVKEHGAIGAAWTTVATEVIIAALCATSLMRQRVLTRSAVAGHRS